MFQFGGFPAYTYFIQCTLYGSSPHGFPHSEIRGSTDICSSPRLIAACHVLLRLLMPRHSPCALLRLNSLRFSRLNCCNHIHSYFLAKLFPISRKDHFLKNCLSFSLYLFVSFLLYSVFNELSLREALLRVSALTYLPGQSPAKYCRHCAA